MPRKKPWYLQLTSSPYQATAIYSYAANNEESFTRQVRLNFRLDNRELRVKLTPREARIIAARLQADADRAEEMNREHGNGGQYTENW